MLVCVLLVWVVGDLSTKFSQFFTSFGDQMIERALITYLIIPLIIWLWVKK